MAYCLAVDTSGKTLSLALSQDYRLLGERFLDCGLTHSETFLAQVDGLLRDLQLSFQDLDLLAVTVGPGSYTGIRIGLASLKSLAWLLQIPLFAYDSLGVLNSHYPATDRFLLTLLDARGGRVFSALYRGKQRILPIANRQAAALLGELKELFYLGRHDRPTVYLSGDGSEVFQAAFETDDEASEHFRIQVICPDMSDLRAGDLARLAFLDYQAGKRPGWEEATALYASPTQAERVRREQLALVKIRPAEPQDVDIIHQIELASFSTPWSRKSLAHQLSPENKITHLFVAYRDFDLEEDKLADGLLQDKSSGQSEEILGYGGYTLHFDEAEILNVAVLDSVRQKGIGRKLMSSIMGDAISRGAVQMTLEVRESNQSARRLYNSLGFQSCGLRKNYYDKPREDALILLWQAGDSAK